MEWLADDDLVAVDDLTLVEQKHLEAGLVDEDVATAELLRQPAPALHVDDDLPDPLVGGDVHGGDRLWTGDTVRIQPIAALEMLDHGDNVVVIEIGLGVVDTGVAACLEIGPHLADARIRHPGFQRAALVDRRPAAFRRQRAIALQHLAKLEILRMLGSELLDRAFDAGVARQR